LRLVERGSTAVVAVYEFEPKLQYLENEPQPVAPALTSCDDRMSTLRLFALMRPAPALADARIPSTEGVEESPGTQECVRHK